MYMYMYIHIYIYMWLQVNRRTVLVKHKNLFDLLRAGDSNLPPCALLPSGGIRDVVESARRGARGRGAEGAYEEGEPEKEGWGKRRE